VNAIRVGWATPFNTRSAIGKFSKVVCDELCSRGYDVEIIRIEAPSELAWEALDSSYPVKTSAAVDLEVYDLVVVNFGNHSPYHRQSLDLISKRSVLAIFHDAEMRDFAWGMMDRHSLAVPLLPAIALDEPGAVDLVDAEAKPLLQTIAAMACGAIIHGPHYLQTVEAYCPGPVKVIRLCYPDTDPRPHRAPLSAKKIVTIFGVISEHKQPRRLMQALAKIKKSVRDVEMHLAGSVEEPYREKLLEEAKQLGIMRPVFHGYLPDPELQDLLESSHAICCLRYPVTEGGSASLITALYRGRPLIVSDVASYSMVPDDLVSKVSYGDDANDLAAELTKLFADEDGANRRAARAKDWARDKFSASSYVDSLTPLIDQAIRRSILVDLSRNLATAVRSPSGELMMQPAGAFARVLEWMTDSQK
jgi:Glycosyltransferase